ncbi:MAG: hypothetical protein Q4F67_10325 [Propionibacteriaceae bacterium]|nr:hypothetical protein [Propionibacteriaceae bacterium]
MIVLAAFIGVVSLISNITSIAQLSGQADAFLAVRFTVSKIVNSGAVWAGMLVLAGWLVRRPVHAALAGLVAGMVALVVHYGLGQVLGLNEFGSAGWEIWAANRQWFLAALIFGPPLGLVGSVARRANRWGLVARLVVPVAAGVEPFLLGMFTQPDFLPAPTLISSNVTGVVLVIGGLVGAVLVIRGYRRARSTKPEPVPVAGP